MLSDKYRYVSLETPDVRTAALEDPRGFMEVYSPPVIFDEVQYAGFAYVHQKANRCKPGPTGPVLTHRISKSPSRRKNQ
jgi:hypothetical protein